jgi:P-type E1-E2 ATPase
MSVHVIREGSVQYIDALDLLVGDILTIQIGDLLPVDGILLEGSELLMDESTITGESEMI